MSGAGLDDKHGKISQQASLQICRLIIRSEGGKGQPHTRTLADLKYQNTGIALQTGLSGPAVDVPIRVANSHRKTTEEQLEGSRITRKGNPHPKVTPP